MLINDIKYIYILYGNRKLGSKHWYIVKVFRTKEKAEYHAKKYLCPKWGKSFGYSIQEFKVY